MLNRCARFRIGALLVDVEAPEESYLERLSALYEAPEIPRSGDAAPLSVTIDVDPETQGTPDVPPDGIVVRTGVIPEVHTEAISLRIDRRASPIRASLCVRRPDIGEYELAVHFSVVYSKLLALIGYVRLHAAAATLGRGAFVFVGEKGSGKSTITLAMGRAGGTVLADDDVMVRRDAGRVVASGCDETIRITPGTEEHFFPEPLPIVPMLSGGEPKKELRAGDLFPSRPYHEETVEAIVFPRVEGPFELIPMTRQRAVLALLENTRTKQRFGGGEDFGHHLGLLGEILDGVPAYQLQLGTRLEEIDRLADLLVPQRERAEGNP